MKKLFMAVLVWLFLAAPVFGGDSYYAGFAANDFTGKSVYVVERGRCYLIRLDFGESRVNKSIFDLSGFEGRVQFESMGQSPWLCGERRLIITNTEDDPRILIFELIRSYPEEKRYTVWAKVVLAGDNGFPFYTEMDLFYDQESGYDQAWRFMSASLPVTPSAP